MSLPNQPPLQVAIIGAGLAGLSAALTLSEHPVHVHLFEKRKVPGGRVRAIHNPIKDSTIDRLDNGQHALTGAHHYTLSLINQFFDHPPLCQLPAALIFPNKFEIRPKTLPAPFHWLSAFMLSSHCGMPEIKSVIKLGYAIVRHKHHPYFEDIPLEIFCQQQKISQACCQYLIEPLCLAALNTPIQQASTHLFLTICQPLFFQGRINSDTFFPTVDLTALLVTPMLSRLPAQIHTLHTQHSVLNIKKASTSYLLTIQNKDTQYQACFDAIIIATGAHEILPLTTPFDALTEFNQMIGLFGFETIETLYLKYPEKTKLPYPMMGMTQGFGQWAFDLGQMQSHHPKKDRDMSGWISIVHSASGGFEKSRRLDFIKETHQHLKHIGLHSSATDFPEHHVWTVEKKATWRCTPNLKRPFQQNLLPNLWIAGDYTEPTLPATIESALISGHKAAQQLLNHFLAGK